MTGTHNVYVVELDRSVLKHKKVQKLNPKAKSYLPPLYVGMTGLTPEQRFAKHKEGLKANAWVQKYGLNLRPELYKGLSNLKFQEAENKEEQIAKKLRAKGYTVLGGNPQMRKLGSESLEQKEPHKAGVFGSGWLNGLYSDSKTLDGHMTHADFIKKFPHWTTKKADWTEFDKERDANLPPQQARVVKKIQQKDTNGLVLFHGMGSGKTRASLESYKALGMPADIIVPAALQENYRKESRKWLGNVPSNMNIVSQQRLANPRLKTPLNDNGLQVVDEAQKARNDKGELYQMLSKTHPKKRLLLSGTPMLNNPAELGNLVNLAAGKPVLPNNISDFKKQYFKPQEVNPGLLGRLTGVQPGIEYKLQNKKQLGGILDKYVDYYKPTQEGYPTVNEEVVKVPMGDKQQDLYNSILGKANWWTRYKVKHNIPPGRGELDGMRAFLSGPRQVSNSTSGFTTKVKDVESPKINAAFKFLQAKLQEDPSYKAMVYSNYLNNGIRPYEELLKKNNIPFGEFSGDTTPTLRNQAVQDFNANKIRALLISGAGAEGLDLKGTRLEQLLDPHWNLAKERQVIGRGARFHSHDGLPPEKQNVLVQRYFAEPKASLFDKFTFNPRPTGTDEYIHNLAKRKDQMNQEIVDLIDKDRQSHSWLPAD